MVEKKGGKVEGYSIEDGVEIKQTPWGEMTVNRPRIDPRFQATGIYAAGRSLTERAPSRKPRITPEH